MKIAAHPMMVAVALGLLPPTALAEDSMGDLSEERAGIEVPVEAPTRAEQDRVAREWELARTRVDE